ncbi:MAG: LEA14-like dessication related protein [Methanobacteriota archaeon]|jgi:LEA14-like dessication related protein|uniref:LEA type 2 family protein n=1 Tax=Halorutilus salinus TaxID=2487751 RepID=A0A9Q4C4V2_9EURY|nr:LEA type 2 family protein [Halorutilus salinus]MCX2819206.1 LEA type 2 family protein [Halorutilus salinus]
MRLPSGDGIERGVVTSRWGDVSDEASEIRTEVSVPSANVVNRDTDTFGVEYVAEINGVRVVEAEKSGFRFDPRTTSVSLDAEMEHDAIRGWWGTHVENGEESSMRVKPRLRVDLPLSDLGVRVPSRETTVETDALGFLNDAGRRERSVMGRTFLAVDGIDAEWGEPDGGTTPVHVEARVENPTRVPVSFSDLVCDVRMNGVDVGGGETHDGFALGAGETETVEMTVNIEDDALPDWWRTHVENGEETEVVADVYGAVGVLGRRFRVPLISYTGAVETDVLT